MKYNINNMVFMSHIREASKVTVNTSYLHPANQHYTDEAHKAETVLSVIRYRSMAFRSY
jgi:predicted glutamine amidotransferase